MNRMLKIATISLLSVFLFSCATKIETYDEYPITTMADDNTIVVTLDASVTKDAVFSMFSDAMVRDRSNRLSLALVPDSDDLYPLDTDSMGVYGVLQGNFPRFLSNIAISNIDGFHKEGKHYSDGNIALKAEKSDRIFFAKQDYEAHRDSFFSKNAPLNLTQDKAEKLYSYPVALYVKEPKTFFDLGIDINQAVIDSIVDITVGFDPVSGRLDAIISMDNPKYANTLSMAIKTKYTGELRRQKQKIDFNALKEMLVLSDQVFLINQMPVSQEQIDQMNSMISSFI